MRDGERRGSERREESVTRLQTKEERSLAAGDEFQEFEGKVEPRRLCARWQCDFIGSVLCGWKICRNSSDGQTSNR